MFQVEERIEDFSCYTNKSIVTNHLAVRDERIKAYKDLGLLSDKFVDGFIVDKGHINGKEVHLINENGLIYIYNLHTNKLITILGARPNQIKRYYNCLGIECSVEVNQIIDKSYELVLNENVNNL